MLARLDGLAQAGVVEIVRNLITRARNGDLDAASEVLKRAWPPRRGRPVPLPGLSEAATAAEAFRVVMDAVGRGDISGEEAEVLARLLTAKQGAVDLAEVSRRLDLLEGRTE